MKSLAVLTFCLLCILVECKQLFNKHKVYQLQDDNYMIKTNDISGRQTFADPPDHTKLVEMARYVAHNCNWASIATISVQPAIQGFPFANIKSMVDGYVANSTGIPYFYMSPLDFSAKDLQKNNKATVLLSLEETSYCDKNQIDPEDPRCTRLMISGKMKKLKENSTEYIFAKGALFERHPDFTHYPPDHDWFVAAMRIAQIAMVDWYGGAKFVSVKDYLAYNFTDTDLKNGRNTDYLYV